MTTIKEIIEASVRSKRKQIFRCAAIPKCKHEEQKKHPTF